MEEYHVYMLIALAISATYVVVVIVCRLITLCHELEVERQPVDESHARVTEWLSASMFEASFDPVPELAEIAHNNTPALSHDSLGNDLTALIANYGF